MKKITFNNDLIPFNLVDSNKPIFVKNKEDKLVGMVVHIGGSGWGIYLGGRSYSCGFHETLYECLEASTRFGYTYYVED